jgi:hypothetical protein
MLHIPCYIQYTLKPLFSRMNVAVDGAGKKWIPAGGGGFREWDGLIDAYIAFRQMRSGTLVLVYSEYKLPRKFSLLKCVCLEKYGRK